MNELNKMEVIINIQTMHKKMGWLSLSVKEYLEFSYDRLHKIQCDLIPEYNKTF